MEYVKKIGRKKKEILEQEDLDALDAFQAKIKKSAREIGITSLTSPEKKFLHDFLILKSDDHFTQVVKSLRFKHYILHKPLTQEECTYFIDVDSKGTKPSAERRLTKMSICKIEAAALQKLRKTLGSKLNVFSMKDVFCGDEERGRWYAKPCTRPEE